MTELESIEMKLHNLPKVEGCEICHSHCKEWVIFSAWKGAERVSPRSLRVPIKALGKDFLKDYQEDFHWLIKGGENAESSQRDSKHEEGGGGCQRTLGEGPTRSRN